MSKEIKRHDTKSGEYRSAEDAIQQALSETSIPDAEILENLHLFISPQQLRRILFLYEIYKKIVTVPGVIMQFGVRWGRELALFESLRTTFEPFNHSRKIIGFDTFSGYQGVDERDGGHRVMEDGNLSTGDNYRQELESILALREQMSPIPQAKKYELIEGNAEETLAQYLEDNPQTIISLAHLDMNLYLPTRACLEILKDNMPKGAVVIIDEVNLDMMPGETIALKEVFGINNLRLQRDRHVNPTWPAYFVVE